MYEQTNNDYNYDQLNNDISEKNSSSDNIFRVATEPILYNNDNNNNKSNAKRILSQIFIPPSLSQPVDEQAIVNSEHNGAFLQKRPKTQSMNNKEDKYKRLSSHLFEWMDKKNINSDDNTNNVSISSNSNSISDVIDSLVGSKEIDNTATTNTQENSLITTNFNQQEIDELLSKCDTGIQNATKFLETYKVNRTILSY